jgi:hypothetical protein
MKRTNAAIDFRPLLLWIWVVLALFLALRPPLLWNHGLPDQTTRGRFIIVPGPYLTVQP